MNNTEEPLVVNYESSKDAFKYRDFWRGRDYEDASERMMLRSMIRRYPAGADWLLDIGGSFGRLLDVYSRRFSNVCVIDYATIELSQATQPALKAGVDLRLIAANAYHLPFADGSLPAIISVRVVHHFSDVELFFAEIRRVLAPGGVAIIEAGNKNHIKGLILAIKNRSFKDWRADWVDIGKSGLQADDNYHLIRNYHPRFIKKAIRSSGLHLDGVKSISWLRRTPLARLPRPVAASIERILSGLLSWTLLGPSNWFVVSRPEERIETRVISWSNLDDQLVDPKNGRSLNSRQLAKHTINVDGQKIIDLRHPRPRN